MEPVHIESLENERDTSSKKWRSSPSERGKTVREVFTGLLLLSDDSKNEVEAGATQGGNLGKEGLCRCALLAKPWKKGHGLEFSCKVLQKGKNEIEGRKIGEGGGAESRRSAAHSNCG